jgi:mono/diheme cytochrome c family protein
MIRLVAMGFAATGLAAVLCFSGLAQAQAQGAGDRGTYLMRSIAACGNCHTQNTPQGPRPGMELAGGTRFDEPLASPMPPTSRRISRPESASGRMSN